MSECFSFSSMVVPAEPPEGGGGRGSQRPSFRDIVMGRPSAPDAVREQVDLIGHKLDRKSVV